MRINELNNEITNERKKNEWKNEIKNNEKIITMEQRLIKEWNEMIKLGKNEIISDAKTLPEMQYLKHRFEWMKMPCV